MEWVKKKNKDLFWKNWFAWYPICVAQYENGDKKMVWLKFIERIDTLFTRKTREIGSDVSYTIKFSDTQGG